MLNKWIPLLFFRQLFVLCWILRFLSDIVLYDQGSLPVYLSRFTHGTYLAPLYSWIPTLSNEVFVVFCALKIILLIIFSFGKWSRLSILGVVFIELWSILANEVTTTNGLAGLVFTSLPFLIWGNQIPGGIPELVAAYKNKSFLNLSQRKVPFMFLLFQGLNIFIIYFASMCHKLNPEFLSGAGALQFLPKGLLSFLADFVLQHEITHVPLSYIAIIIQMIIACGIFFGSASSLLSLFTCFVVHTWIALAANGIGFHYTNYAILLILIPLNFHNTQLKFIKKSIGLSLIAGFSYGFFLFQKQIPYAFNPYELPFEHITRIIFLTIVGGLMSILFFCLINGYKALKFTPLLSKSEWIIGAVNEFKNLNQIKKIQTLLLLAGFLIIHAAYALKPIYTDTFSDRSHWTQFSLSNYHNKIYGLHFEMKHDANDWQSIDLAPWSPHTGDVFARFIDDVHSYAFGQVSRDLLGWLNLFCTRELLPNYDYQISLYKLTGASWYDIAYKNAKIQTVLIKKINSTDFKCKKSRYLKINDFESIFGKL